MNKTELDGFLENWYETKQEITKLENKIEKYKRIARKMMDENETDLLHNSTYKLARKDGSRTTIGKDDLPEDIWNRYSKKTYFTSFYISKNTEKKKKRSV